MQSTIGMLSIEQAAGELGADELTMQRLIARGNVAGHQIGKGAVMIDADDLKRYVIAGARDFDPPKTLNGWIHDPDTAGSAHSFRQAVAAAMGEQVPDVAPTGDRVELRADAAIKAIAAQRVPRLVNVAGKTDGARIEQWLTAYVVDALRREAWRIVREGGEGRSPLDVLYASRADYQRVVNEAAVAVLGGSIVVRQDYPGEGPGIVQPRIVRFVLPHKELGVNDAVLRASAILAF